MADLCRSHSLLVIMLALCGASCCAQDKPAKTEQQSSDKQINVNWLYGSYIPKEVPRRALNGSERLKLYVRQTYLTPGIYVKTMGFALHDQITDRNPEWGDDFSGFAKRLGDRQAQFVIQNSLSSLGNAVLGWEPRYDRCRCDGFWPRTRYAVLRNFVTYDRTERALRPQLMPYLGAFGASAISTSWHPGNPSWQVQGYQAVITQFFVGAGVNFLGEFAPEVKRMLHRKKPTVHACAFLVQFSLQAGLDQPLFVTSHSC